MELDDLSQSGIRRVADYSPYLDQLAGLANEMGLRQRSNLVHLERCLHAEWSLGQNSILSWCPLDDGILILPSSPGPAPLLSSGEPERDRFRQIALEFLCPAGLAGLPQISVPAGRADHAPVGLSLVAPRGADAVLLTLARAFGPTIDGTSNA